MISAEVVMLMRLVLAEDGTLVELKQNPMVVVDQGPVVVHI